MKKVLFICTGNTCRSPMAQAIFNSSFKKGEYVADSCGIYADDVSPISANAKEVLKNHGIEFEYTSKQASYQLLEESNLIICMTQNHYRLLVSAFKDFEEKIFAMPYDISDPYGQDLQAYEKCFNEIKAGIDESFKNL